MNNVDKFIEDVIRAPMAGGRPTFTTLSNTGNMEGYTNACMWISVLQYLQRCKTYNLTLTYLRNKFDTDRSFGQNEAFDYHKAGHHKALDLLCNSYNLRVDIYYANYERGGDRITATLGNRAYHFGNRCNMNIVPIVAYGEHFELIIDPYLCNCPSLTNRSCNLQQQSNPISSSSITGYVPKIYNINTKVFEPINKSDVSTFNNIEVSNKVLSERLPQVSSLKDMLMARQLNRDDLVKENEMYKDQITAIDISEYIDSEKNTMLKSTNQKLINNRSQIETLDVEITSLQNELDSILKTIDKQDYKPPTSVPKSDDLVACIISGGGSNNSNNTYYYKYMKYKQKYLQAKDAVKSKQN